MDELGRPGGDRGAVLSEPDGGDGAPVDRDQEPVLGGGSGDLALVAGAGHGPPCGSALGGRWETAGQPADAAAHPATRRTGSGHHIRYVVPLFQRPYVWTEERQWRPLWEDVQAVAEGLLEAPAPVFGAPPVPPHFLGAVVLDQQMIPAGFIAVRHVVDGQQRLTTLQLLLDAAQWVVEQHGAAMDAQALRVLVLNDPAIAQYPDEVFKVWPTDRDREAFRAAMDNAAVVPPDLVGSRIAQAHAFFVAQIGEWADVHGDPDKASARLNALVRALRDHLRLVVIDLEPGDNAQVIFETLNHRGTPLLAADLVKNLVFQLAQARALDAEALYQKYWKPLDSDSWRQPVAQGRLYRPRIDVFLNHWLTMRLLREVPTDRIFSEFRDHIARDQPDITGLLAELAADAEVYDRMDRLPPGSVAGDFYYRVIRALDSGVVGPFLLWVLRWDQTSMPAAQRDKALQALESWLVRRALCRVTSKDVNRMVLELLRAVHAGGPQTAGDTAEALLAAQRADSRFWPDDTLLHQVLDTEPVYKNLTRPRLRMVLEAVEDSLRGPLGEAADRQRPPATGQARRHGCQRVIVSPGSGTCSRSIRPAAANSARSVSAPSVKCAQCSKCSGTTRRAPRSFAACAAMALDSVR